MGGVYDGRRAVPHALSLDSALAEAAARDGRLVSV